MMAQFRGFLYIRFGVISIADGSVQSMNCVSGARSFHPDADTIPYTRIEICL